jgi:methionine sulfoxide reductase heme-binding subunit
MTPVASDPRPRGRVSTPVRATAWRDGRLRRRLLRHHVPFALLSVLIVGGAVAGLGGESFRARLSLGTAYVALLFLSGTLVLGPYWVLRSRPSPVSVDLRRDLGVWTALVSFAHVILGLRVHVHLGDPIHYFLYPSAERPDGIPIRLDAFGVANYLGLAATVLLALLLALSNDAALRSLGARRWKRLQRLNYGVVALVALHAVLYQLIEQRTPPPILLVVLALLAVVGAQLAGVVVRRRRSRMERSAAA